MRRCLRPILRRVCELAWTRHTAESALGSTVGLAKQGERLKDDHLETVREGGGIARFRQRLCTMSCRACSAGRYRIQIPLPPKIDPSVTMMTVEDACSSCMLGAGLGEDLLSLTVDCSIT